MLINYGKQHIDRDDIDSVIKILKSEIITQGNQVIKFENALKLRLGSKFCCALSSGTSGLHLAAMALGWEKEDVVISTPITFLATINCINFVGAKPDFVDINPNYYTIDPDRLEKKIKEYKKIRKRVKAVIAVDYAGHPADWKELNFLAKKYNFQLVNDNCHALGASYLGNKKYATKYANLVIQSFHPVKHITTGEGGAVLTNSRSLDQKIRQLKSHGIEKNFKTMKTGSWYYEMHKPGFNYRITDFQCALGISQLKKLDRFIAIRRKIAQLYNDAFKFRQNCIIPKVDKNSEHAYHLYPVLSDFNKLKTNKRLFFEKMKKKGINLQVHYIPVHLQPYYMKKFKFKKGDFPISENFYEKEFSLPIYPDLKEKQIEFIIEEVYKNLN